MNQWMKLAVVTALAAGGLSATGALIRAQVEPVAVVATEFAFDPNAFTVVAGEPVSVTLTNAGQAPHDITFELDEGRVVGSSVIRGGEETAVGFDAPAAPGAYTFYCSVGNHKERGMVGTLTVEEAPEQFEAVVTGLKSPRGLFVGGEYLYIGEGGTGEAGMGFVAGNLDGQVTKLSLSEPTDRTVIVSDLANAVDPGGGVIGANHAMPMPGMTRTLVALSGGPGHPDPKAQILGVDEAGQSTVLLDMWAFEEANNPDGQEIDSNPWRLAIGPNGDGYVSDAGANDVLRIDNTDCTADCASVFAVFDAVGEDPDGAPISAVPTGLAWTENGEALYVSLLASFAAGEAQVRRLEDTNGDGDAMDEGENTIALDGLTMAVDLAFDPSGRLWVIEFGGFAAQGRLVEVQKTGSGRAVEGLPAPSGLAFTSEGDALVAVGTPGSGFVTSQVIRIPWERLSGEAPTPTATTPPTEEPTGGIYLPWSYRP